MALVKVKELEIANIIYRVAIYLDEFHKSLSTFDTFGRGWLERNDATNKTGFSRGLEMMDFVFCLKMSK